MRKTSATRAGTSTSSTRSEGNMCSLDDQAILRSGELMGQKVSNFLSVDLAFRFS